MSQLLPASAYPASSTCDLKESMVGDTINDI